MELHSWNEIIKYFSDNAESQTILWDYVTALRGPDIDNPDWKLMLTCLLRGQCSDALDITDTFSYVRNESFTVINKQLTATLEQLPIHYLFHTVNGFRALSEYYYKEMGNAQLAELFLELSLQLSKQNLFNIVFLVEEIVDIMHDGKE